MTFDISSALDQVMPAAVATGLFVSLVTIQQPDGETTPSGAPSGLWIDVAGMVGIAAMDAPSSVPSITANESKSIDKTTAYNEDHVLLSGYYPGILDGWRAVVDGVNYDVLGTEHDSQFKMTRVRITLVSE